ncbi:hypothetical protein CEXT_761521 [Caerostris extrusa]|uniref:Uncharacterized protein n=1 Tax=Caerostris extrusa TaxID=172846 RepID=A0AAV4NHU7_CAEEX|nr:hypothetical protein CEXT_761521 [Caerostris extrusa]
MGSQHETLTLKHGSMSTTYGNCHFDRGHVKVKEKGSKQSLQIEKTKESSPIRSLSLIQEHRAVDTSEL